MSLNNASSPNESDFYLGEVNVKVNPLFNSDKILFIKQELGPFRQNYPIEIPLWIALELKKKQKVKIYIPDYYFDEYIKQKIIEENNSKDSLCKLEFYFFDMFKILGDNCNDEIKNYISLKALVDKLKDIRHLKIMNIFENINKETEFLELENFTYFEINLFKNLFSPLSNLYNFNNLK